MIYIFLPFLCLFGSFGVSFYSVNSGVTSPLRGTFGAAILVIIIAFLVFIAGFIVLAYKKGKLPKLTGVQSARILALGQAALIAGLMLLGIWGGNLLGEYQIWDIIFSKFSAEILAIISAILLIVAGVNTIFNCRIDGDEDDKKPNLMQSKELPNATGCSA